MTGSDSGIVRDAAKPREYYEGVIELLEKYIQAYLEKGPPLYSSVAEYNVRLARAAYSAGEPAARCKKYLKQSATYQARFFREGTDGKLAGFGQLERYLEWFGAADLVGNGAEVVAAFRSLSVTGVLPWQESLMSQLCAVFAGEPFVLRTEQVDQVARIKEYKDLPQLFRAMSDRDAVACEKALESFLTASWGPSADRAARKDLKAPYPLYTGRWSVFSAAACRRIGKPPGLSKKALQYVPLELAQP